MAGVPKNGSSAPRNVFPLLGLSSVQSTVNYGTAHTLGAVVSSSLFRVSNVKIYIDPFARSLPILIS